jgi:hypothetical protein
MVSKLLLKLKSGVSPLWARLKRDASAVALRIKQLTQIF